MNDSREEVDPRRDGGMKSIPSGDLLHESRMPKTVFHPASGLIMAQYDDDDDDTFLKLRSFLHVLR